MAARLGIMYVIYNRKIWASYSPGWRDYTGADPHTSHIHISLSWNGARGHTSFWTGRTWALDYGACQVFAGQPAAIATKRARTTPCDPPATTRDDTALPLLWMGSTGTTVGTGAAPAGHHRRPGPSTEPPAARCSPTKARTNCREPERSTTRPGRCCSPTSIKASKPAWTPAAGARWAQRHGYPDVRVGDAGRRVYALQCALRLPSSRADQLLRAALPAPQCSRPRPSSACPELPA